MKKILILLLFSGISARAQTFKSGDVVNLEGDSITAAGWWTSYFEAYYVQMYPSNSYHFRPEGHGGAYVTTDPYEEKNSAHLIYPTPATQTNWFVMMWGHNGGADSNTFLIDVSNRMQTAYGTNNPKIILFGANPVQDGSGSVARPRSMAMKALAAQSSIPGVDTYNSLSNLFATDYAGGEQIDLGWQTNGTPNVHPGAAGHLCMTDVLLAGLGEDTNTASAVTINWNGLTVSSNYFCDVSNLTQIANGIQFDRGDYRLPFAWDNYSGETSLGAKLDATPALALMPQISNLCAYIISVTNLPSGTFTMVINGTTVSTNITDTQLASGLNLRSWTNTPIWFVGTNVLGLIRTKCWVNTTNPSVQLGIPRHGMGLYDSSAVNEYVNLGNRGQTLWNNLQDEETDINSSDTLIHTAAQPPKFTFQITQNTLPVPHLWPARR